MNKNYSNEKNNDNNINRTDKPENDTKATVTEEISVETVQTEENNPENTEVTKSKSIIGKFIRKIIYNDKILLFLSVFTGIFVWAYVTHKEYPDSEELIKGVHIDFDASIRGTEAEREGYRIYGADISKVDINVKANRTKLAFLDKNDFYATVSVDNYVGEQPVSASIQIFKSNENDVNCSYELYDSTYASIYLYKEVTKKIPVEVSAPNIKAAAGYKIKSITSEEITVTGPDPIVNSISRCVLNLNYDTSYDERKSHPVSTSLDKLIFYDEEDNSLNGKMQTYFAKDKMKLDKEDIIVTVSVSKIKELALTYNIDNIPSYLDPQFIRDRIVLEPEAISVSTDDPSLDNIDVLPVASDENLSLNKIDIGYQTTFDITKALESYPKLTNDSKVQECVVTFNSEGLDTKTFEVLSNFTFKNPYSAKYKAEAVTQCLNNVKVIGPANDIARLKADDLILEIDVSKNELSSAGQPNIGQSTYTVSVMPKDQKKFKNIWVVGQYEADVNITQIPDETEVTTVTTEND